MYDGRVWELRTGMSAKGISLPLRVDAEAETGLQHQIRAQLVQAIHAGAFPPGRRLPSSRALARHLGVARNTVVLACQHLVAEGQLVARPRSGLYVNEEVVKGLAPSRRTDGQDTAGSIDWTGRVTQPPVETRWRCPPDWQKYPYPFVANRFDRSLFPHALWREALRIAFSARETEEWCTAPGDADDMLLSREVCSKYLFPRGIRAGPDQVLLTGSGRDALALVCELLVANGARVGVEEPADPGLLDALARRGAKLSLPSADAQGIRRLADTRCDVVFVSSRRQGQRHETTPFSLAERKRLLAAAHAADFILVEDDTASGRYGDGEAQPALFGLPGGDRVVYVGGSAPALAPAFQFGFLVGAPALVDAARRLRARSSAAPPIGLQRAAAHFFALGHHDRTLRRLEGVFGARVIALRDALNHYLPQSVAIASVHGGTTLRVHGPEDLDARRLAAAAEARGVLIEPGEDHARSSGPGNVFRMSVTGIDGRRIRTGVAVLAEVMHDIAGGRIPWLDPQRQDWLNGRELRRQMPGATLLYKTVYGDPCTIELSRDGGMTGKAGYAGEDRDEGRWWIEGDLWCRQWQSWAYGETVKFRTRIDGDRIQWFNASGRLVDSAILVRRRGAVSRR